MMVYTTSAATGGNFTANGTPNTETETFFLKPGSTRPAKLFRVDVLGKGAALATLSAIVFRLVQWATASTSGTGMTPRAKDPGMQAAVSTSASRPTSGSTRTNRQIFGCGAASPGGWWAIYSGAKECLPAGSAASISALDASGTASLTFEISFEHEE